MPEAWAEEEESADRRAPGTMEPGVRQGRVVSNASEGSEELLDLIVQVHKPVSENHGPMLWNSAVFRLQAY